MSYCMDCSYHDMDSLEFPSLHSELTQAQLVSVRFLRDQDLFVQGQHVTEDVEEDVNMVLLENQRRTETY